MVIITGPPEAQFKVCAQVANDGVNDSAFAEQVCVCVYIHTYIHLYTVDRI